MKEIVYFLPDADAGVTSIVRNLLKYRPKSNFRYKVIFTRQLERDTIHVDDQFNVDEQITFEYSKYENLFTVFRRLKKHISSPDSIIVANDGLELRMVRALKLHNPLVYIIHGDFKYYYMLSEQNQGIIDKFIAYSKYTEQQLKEMLSSQNLKKIKLQYYPVPETQFIPTTVKNIDLIFVGTFNERKGVQFLKEIYDEVIKSFPDLTFKIIGSGELNEKLRTDFEKNSQVTFAGQLSNTEVIKEMQKSKILVFPSLSEGLPNVVVEAMKAHCVPVCSDINSGIPDLIDHGKNGYKVKIGDITTFANYIIKILKNNTHRLDLADHAHSKASNMFNPTTNAANYEKELIGTAPHEKIFPNYSLGKLLNQPFLPNEFVKLIRKMHLSPKL